ncbi:MAG: universal stress protein [Syntrophomonas sp.]|nr:universal stress protein [Syntrophomonas sp.]
MFNRVLVATDGSESAMGAVKLAKEMMLNGFVKHVTLIHVVENAVDWKSYSIINTKFNNAEEFNKAVVEKGTQALQAAEDLFKQSGLTVDSSIRFGKPEEEIVGHSEKHNCDLIIMGNRGLSKMEDIILGSISKKVMHLAKAGVIVYKS